MQDAVLLRATCPSEIAIDFRWAGTCCVSHVLFIASTSPEESATTNAMDDQTVSAAALGTIRYVGAYCFAKVKYRLTSTLRHLVSIPDPATLQRVQLIQQQLEWLDCVIRSEAQIASNTENIPSTHVTSARQNTANSLVHITDMAMIFLSD